MRTPWLEPTKVAQACAIIDVNVNVNPSIHKEFSMEIAGKVFIVTGGASGLGEGTARMLAAKGGKVVIADMQVEKGEAIAKDIGGAFVKCDVSSEADGQAVVAKAVSMGKLMGLVNCAGIAPAEKTVGKNGAHALASFSKTITVNLIGSFNMIRLAADAMSKNEPEATGERGAMISTASVAAYDGQIGQAAYSASKGGVVGMTLPIARDLARNGIRNMTIAPGIFGTPMLFSMPQEVQDALAAGVPFPSRLGTPQDYAKLAVHIFENDMLNGEVIRLDGAIRLAPK
jgi:NAD(P)-dependent dehydrogenase (short-subunit alcohol dehydrogenase family)